MDESELKKVFELSFSPNWTNVSKYIIKQQQLNKTLFEDTMNYYVFTYPAIYFSEGHAKHGGSVWMYRFDYESNVFDGDLKAFHALEIPFVWNNMQKAEAITGNDPQRYKLAQQMHQAWIAFAHHGDPNIPELQNWPQYDLENRATILFNTSNEVVNDPNSQERLKWEQVFQK